MPQKSNKVVTFSYFAIPIWIWHFHFIKQYSYVYFWRPLQHAMLQKKGFFCSLVHIFLHDNHIFADYANVLISKDLSCKLLVIINLKISLCHFFYWTGFRELRLYCLESLLTNIPFVHRGTLGRDYKSITIMIFTKKVDAFQVQGSFKNYITVNNVWLQGELVGS